MALSLCIYATASAADGADGRSVAERECVEAINRHRTADGEAFLCPKDHFKASHGWQSKKCVLKPTGPRIGPFVFLQECTDFVEEVTRSPNQNLDAKGKVVRMKMKDYSIKIANEKNSIKLQLRANAVWVIKELGDIGIHHLRGANIPPHQAGAVPVPAELGTLI